MILFLESNLKSKGPDGYSVSRKFLAGGIAIDLWGLEILRTPKKRRDGPEVDSKKKRFLFSSYFLFVRFDNVFGVV